MLRSPGSGFSALLDGWRYRHESVARHRGVASAARAGAADEVAGETSGEGRVNISITCQ